MRHVVSGTLLLLLLLACPVVAQVSPQELPMAEGPGELLFYILITTVVTGGFGGFVHGILRQTAVHYEVTLPFVKTANPREAGFLGDVVVGIAAAVTLFLVLDSIFLLNVQDLAKANNFHAWLKFIAVGVIGGYIGPGILDTLAVSFSKKLAQEQKDLAQVKAELERTKQKLKTSAEVSEALILARAFRTWKHWDHALSYFDKAIKLEPGNPDNYLEESICYARRAEEDHDPSLYEQAIRLTQNAIDADKSSARAYYDRACYRTLSKRASLQEILSDLKNSIDLNAVYREVAQHDPDFESIRKNEEFTKIVGTEAAAS